MKQSDRFCTAVNCLDGRVQLPVIEYMRERFDIPYVDSVTEAGPIRVMAEGLGGLDSILSRIGVSVEQHASEVVAVVAHHDCTGNPEGRDGQLGQLARSMDLISEHFPEVLVLGLWVGETWGVEEVRRRDPKE